MKWAEQGRAADWDLEKEGWEIGSLEYGLDWELHSEFSV